MTNTIDLVAIVGSLRTESFHRVLLRAGQELVAGLDIDVTLTEVSLGDVPFYNGDVEAAGDPAAVTELKAAVDEADGLVIFTPEYNRSIPAVTKNAIDWLSRFPGNSVLSRTAVGIVAATPGGHDVSGVRGHLGQSVGSNTERLFEPSLGIASISEKVVAGVLADDDTRRRLARWLEDFANYLGTNPA